MRSLAKASDRRRFGTRACTILLQFHYICLFCLSTRAQTILSRCKINIFTASRQIFKRGACIGYICLAAASRRSGMCVRKVIRHAHKIPFHCDIGVSSGQKSAEVQIFLDCGKHALRLNGTIDPEQDPFGCGNLFLHQWICKVDICRWVKNRDCILRTAYL